MPAEGRRRTDEAVQPHEITSKDWELAGIVMAVSDRTREQVQAQLAADAAGATSTPPKASGARKIVETRMAAKAEAEDIARVAEVIVTALTKADGHALPGWEVNRAYRPRPESDA